MVPQQPVEPDLRQIRVNFRGLAWAYRTASGPPPQAGTSPSLRPCSGLGPATEVYQTTLRHRSSAGACA